MESHSNTYTIKDKPIKEVLDNIDNFMSNITKFTTKHKGYSYRINIGRDPNNELWNAEIIIKHDKQETKAAKTAVEPPTLLQ
jgi:CYTH domain-containing protein